MKKHTTKRALLMSALSLLVCVSMLVGSTFAWFTDSASSDRNIIQAGNLDVTLEYWDGVSYKEVTSSTKLFNDEALWEPGHAEVAYLRIDNAGSLALKYQLAVNVYNETAATNVAGEEFKLSDHLVFSVVEKELASAADMYTREQAIAAAGNTMGLSSYNSGTVKMLPDDTDYVALIIYMPTSVGNEANYRGTAPTIELGTTLVATQMASEQDSWNENFDKDATYPAVSVVNNNAATTLGVAVAPSATQKATQVTVPAGAFPNNTKVDIDVTTENSLFNVSADGAVVGKLNVVLRVNDVQERTELADGKLYTVVTYISTGLTNVSVAYTGTDGLDQPTLVSYDPATGELVFTTNHFSEYAVSGSAIAYDAAKDAAFTTTDEVVTALQGTDAAVEIVDGLKTEVVLDLAAKVQDAIDKGLIEDDAPVLEGVQDAIESVIAYVATADELNAALAAGKCVTLTDNITVTAPVVVSQDILVIMDLGGYTLSGSIDKLLQFTAGNITLQNGTIRNVHEAATTTNYSVYMSGNAVAQIKNVNIVTSGVGIQLTGNAKITELNANVNSFMNANGYCTFDAVSLLDNARIDAITGGEYVTRIDDAYIQSWFEDPTHKYSGNESWTININGDNASIGTISGGTFLGVFDKANNGTPIHVNAGKVELISGGYFGFVKTGLQNPYNLLFINKGNGAQICAITGGTFEKGSSKVGFNCDFENIVTGSGCKVESTGETVDVNIQFSTRVATYTLSLVQVVSAQ